MREPPLIGDLAAHAFFIDFDGTLVEIAERPELASISPAAVGVVVSMHGLVGGALAIISGRDIVDIDRYFWPHVLPVAGVHGLRRRDGAGRFHAFQTNDLEDGNCSDILANLRREPGILTEVKAGAIAIHYRAVPKAAALCLSAAHAITERYSGMHVLEGKMVFEVKPKAHNKGNAVRTFMAEAPFAGRRPVFVGDDATDEDGFRMVNGMGGMSIKVGAGETAATYRAKSTTAVVEWLARLASDRGNTGQ